MVGAVSGGEKFARTAVLILKGIREATKRTIKAVEKGVEFVSEKK